VAQHSNVAKLSSTIFWEHIWLDHPKPSASQLAPQLNSRNGNRPLWSFIMLPFTFWTNCWISSCNPWRSRICWSSPASSSIPFLFYAGSGWMDAYQQVSCSASLIIVLTPDHVRITTFSEHIWSWCSHCDSCLICLNGELWERKWIGSLIPSSRIRWVWRNH
jgi:hypothetical protein